MKISGELNITLANHYIPNEAWITGLTVTIYGQHKRTPNREANIYIYNYTAGNYIDMGKLNSTTRASLTYTPPASGIPTLVDEKYKNVIRLKYNWTHSVISAYFYADIDYVEVAVTYQFNISVGSWATTQTNSTVVVDEPGNYTVNYWENCTLSAPSGITAHNFTVYINPPDKTKLANHKVYVDNKATAATVTGGEVSLNVVNLVANSTSLNFNAKDMLTVSYPRTRYYLGDEYYVYAGAYKKYACEMRVVNNFAELIAENVIVRIKDATSTVIAEVHPECNMYYSRVYKNGTDITAVLTVKSPYQYVAPSITVNPGVNFNYTLVEVLPPVNFIETGGTVLSNVVYQGGINRLTFNASSAGNRTFVIQSPREPAIVSIDGAAIKNYVYNSTARNLTIKYDFGITQSTHKFEIRLFHACFIPKISPELVSAGDCWFTIKIINNATAPPINSINITYPPDTNVTFLDTRWEIGWIIAYNDAAANTLAYTPSDSVGLPLNGSATFKIRLNITETAGWEKNGYPLRWSVLCKNSYNETVSMDLTITVDDDKPQITFESPTSSIAAYSVGSGNRIWINVTISDNINLTKYPPCLVAINDTRFECLGYVKGADDYTYHYYFANTSMIRDGKLAVKISAADHVNNMNYKDALTEVDNIKPEVISIRLMDNQIGELLRKDNTFYLSKNSTSMNIIISFYEIHPPTTNIVYVNGTAFPFTNGTWFGNINITSSNYLVINNITISDSAYPRKNTLTVGPYYIRRDLTPPTSPTYSGMKKICGGAILEGINATDNIAVRYYRISIGDGSTFIVYPNNLTSPILVHEPRKAWFAFNNKLILNITGHSTVNISITVVDYALNEKLGDTFTIEVPGGMWYPMELQPKWNMISLPLIPNSTLTADIYSLILKQGASGVVVTYAYDHYLDKWILNPTTMQDGYGYWVYMKAYDVLIVQGIISPTPPATPKSYIYTLKAGF